MTRYSTFGLILLLVPLVAIPLGQAQEKPKTATKRDLKVLVLGNNSFAFKLYARMAQKTGNIVFSPHSISTALAMTYAGARGETAAQMAQVLCFTLPADRLHLAFGQLNRQLQEERESEPYRLELANALWFQQGSPVGQDFGDLVGSQYRAGLTPVDFRTDPEAACQMINRWIAARTHNSIKALLAPNDVNEKTVLAVTNAAYFKGNWAQPFAPDQTRDDDFEVVSNNTVKVPMMHHRQAQLRYHRSGDFQALELPYAGDSLSLLVLLPNKKGGLVQLEQHLTARKLDEALSHLTLHIGDVALPRFKIRFRCRLQDELQALGMALPFTDSADFSAIFRDGAWKISRVIHQATISVEEGGTEAAAATAVIGDKSLPPRMAFQANHPFLFLLRERETGAILFMGRVTDARP